MMTLITLGTGAIFVAALSGLLHMLGKGLRDCPISGPAANGATITVLGAYVSMGLGTTALVAAFAGEMSLGDLPQALVAVGGIAVTLGIGFTIAATTLRDALLRVRQEARADAKAGIVAGLPDAPKPEPEAVPA